MTDWREQAYEDAYWAEKVAVSTWSVATQELFLAAVAERAANRADVIADMQAEMTTE